MPTLWSSVRILSISVHSLDTDTGAESIHFLLILKFAIFSKKMTRFLDVSAIFEISNFPKFAKSQKYLRFKKVWQRGNPFSMTLRSIRNRSVRMTLIGPLCRTPTRPQLDPRGEEAIAGATR